MAPLIDRLNALDDEHLDDVWSWPAPGEELAEQSSATIQLTG